MAELSQKIESRYSSGVERIIGNDEADSSILSSGTISSFFSEDYRESHLGRFFYRDLLIHSS